MMCSQCGCEQVGGGQFCRQCGARTVAAAPPPGPGYNPGYYPGADYVAAEHRQRLQQNLQPLGIGWLIFGAYRIIMGLVACLTLHTLSRSGLFSIAGDMPAAFLPRLLAGLTPVIAVTAAFMGLLALFTGFSLLTRKSWARPLAIVLGILSLIKIPFGTAVGIYTLWVLAPRASGDEWQRIQQSSSAAPGPVWSSAPLPRP